MLSLSPHAQLLHLFSMFSHLCRLVTSRYNQIRRTILVQMTKSTDIVTTASSSRRYNFSRNANTIRTRWACSHLLAAVSLASLFTMVRIAFYSFLFMTEPGFIYLLLPVDLTNTSSLTHLVMKEMNNDGKHPKATSDSTNDLLNRSF